jgi:hypothetical protein
MDGAGGGVLMVLQGSRRSWWAPMLLGRAVLGLQLLLFVGRGRHRQSAERARGFVQVHQRQSSGWLGGGGAAPLRPPVCIQLGSCFSASCGRRLPLCWVFSIGMCASC